MTSPAALVVRPVTERDVDRAGDIDFMAFQELAVRHGTAPTVTTPADCRSYLRHLAALDPDGGIVAELGDELVGVAWVHRRGPVATIGPVAVDPAFQGRGVGRALLERCLALARPRAAQVRLVQESFNAESLGLYLRLGFRVVCPLLEVELPTGGQPVPTRPPPAGVVVRQARVQDRTRLVEADARMFGAARPQNVGVFLERGEVLVAERASALVGYGFGIATRRRAYVGSAAGETVETVVGLVAAIAAALAARGLPVRMLIPATDPELVDGALALGFRVAKACHYMAHGPGSLPPANYVLMNGDMM